MRLWLRILLTVLFFLAVLTGVWLYAHRESMARQWAVYRIGTAAGYNEARTAIGWFEAEPDRDVKLRELVRKWGTGNAQFDVYLAQYASDPVSSERFREAFSLNLAWHDDLALRWAHYWSWRPGSKPGYHMRSVLDHLDLLLKASPSTKLTWREILDLQAVFTVTGQPRLALRLSPDNWRERYRQWLAARPEKLPDIVRPAEPFPP